MSDAGATRRARLGGQLVTGLLVALAVATVASIVRNCEALRPVGVGQVAPPVDARLLLNPPAGKNPGDPLGLDAFRGRPVLLQFWASWCPPCRAEIPVLKRLQARHAQAGFTVLGVSVGEPAEDAVGFARQEALPWPVTSGQDGETAGRYGVSTLPHLFLIDGAGVVRRQWIGLAAEAELDGAVQALLR